MLDERHAEPEDFEQSQNDSNAYHWGNIGAGMNCHNVVIASLPGVYGTASAATTGVDDGGRVDLLVVVLLHASDASNRSTSQ